jgi:F-type H+-transporting ATPase subunit b
MDSIIETFHIDWKIIIAQAVNFGIVFVVLYIAALKPLNKLMKERSERISQGINDAKTNKELLGKTEAEYEAALQKARAEANVIFQEGKKEAQVKREEMLEDARGEVARMIEAGKKDLETEKVKMVEEAKKEIVTLTMKATEKVLGAKPDASYEERVVKELNNI